MNRLEKCEFIAHICKRDHLEKPFIRVCEEKTVGNCGKCQKCVRTILEFAVIGQDPREFGFDHGVEHAIKKSRSFMAHHTNGATTVWHFKHMQEKLREKAKNGDPIPEDLAWILDFNTHKKITADIKHQGTINWQDYVDLLPGIEVPLKYRKN